MSWLGNPEERKAWLCTPDLKLTKVVAQLHKVAATSPSPMAKLGLEVQALQPSHPRLLQWAGKLCKGLLFL